MIDHIAQLCALIIVLAVTAVIVVAAYLLIDWMLELRGKK